MKHYSTIRNYLFLFITLILFINPSFAHICQLPTYSDYLSNPNSKIVKQWTTVSDQASDTIFIVPNWAPEDLSIIKLLIAQFPFSSSPLSIEKFEHYDGSITEIYDKSLNKSFFVASFWPGENHYGLIVQKSLTPDGVLRLSIVANINDGDLSCNYYDER